MTHWQMMLLLIGKKMKRVLLNKVLYWKECVHKQNAMEKADFFLYFLARQWTTMYAHT